MIILNYIIRILQKKIVFLLLLMYCFAYSQIGINVPDPDPSTALDIRTKDSGTPGGVSFPSVQLQRATSMAPFRMTPKEGLLLYNPTSVGTIGSLDFVPKGFNYWNGSQWIPFLQNSWIKQGTTSTLARAGEDQYKIGHIGIGDFSTQPIKARLHIKARSNADPVLLEGVRFTDVAPTDRYYSMKITDNGEIRREEVGPPSPSPSVGEILNLSGNNILLVTGTSAGTGGTILSWNVNGVATQNIPLPEDGSYIFSLRMVGRSATAGGSAINVAETYFFSIYKNSVLQEVQTLKVTSIRFVSYVSCPLLYLYVDGKKGDLIQIKGANSVDTSIISTQNLRLSLYGGASGSGTRTSLMFWKI